MTDNISIETLLTPEKIVEFDYPEKAGFKVKICFLSREQSINLREASMTTKFARGSSQPTPQLDEKLFIKNFCKAVVRGWTGLTPSYLEELLLVDISNLENPDAEIPFTPANAETLMRGSVNFDGWVSEIVSELSNFTKDKSST